MNKSSILLAFAALLYCAAGSLAATPKKAAAAPDDTSLSKEIAADPQKAGGIYLAYPVTTDSLPPVPGDYKPVYISHYGRHGSRWAINEKSIHVDSPPSAQHLRTATSLRKANESWSLWKNARLMPEAIWENSHPWVNVSTEALRAVWPSVSLKS